MTLNKKDFAPLSRRRALAALAGAGGAAFFIPAWNETVEAADSIACVSTTPTVTEGPYWVDEKLFRSDIRTDPATGIARAGTLLTLKIHVQNLSGAACSPLAGAYVDIWHCDAKGIYSDEPTYNPGGGTGSVNTSGQKFLRGYQITDERRVRTYSGTTILSNFVTQIFFDETTNNTVLAQSAYARTSARGTTNASDMVYRVANAERMLAAATGDAASGYTATITVGAGFQTPAASAPSISSGGVGNAVSGAAGMASGSWISIYGSSLSTAARTLGSSDLVDNTMPTTLGGVSVRVNNKAAFLQYVSPGQINALVPTDSSLGAVAVTVTNSAGTSNSVTANMLSVLPGLSALENYVRAVRYPDGAVINGTGASEPPYATAAAVGQGDVLALFGTGFGPTNSPVADGVVFSGAYPTSNPVTVTVGGVDASVLWAGLVGPGLYQINVTIPAALSDGDHAVVARVAGASSQANVNVKVAASARLSAQAVSRRLFLAGSRKTPKTLPAPFGNLAAIEHITLLGGLLSPRQRVELG